MAKKNSIEGKTIEVVFFSNSNFDTKQEVVDWLKKNNLKTDTVTEGMTGFTSRQHPTGMQNKVRVKTDKGVWVTYGNLSAEKKRNVKSAPVTEEKTETSIDSLTLQVDKLDSEINELELKREKLRDELMALKAKDTLDTIERNVGLMPWIKALTHKEREMVCEAINVLPGNHPLATPQNLSGFKFDYAKQCLLKFGEDKENPDSVQLFKKLGIS